MNLKERIESFADLGKVLSTSIEGRNKKYSSILFEQINKQHLSNEWFTPEYVRAAIEAIANELTEENLIKWTDAYSGLKEEKTPIKAGVIMAGNIPLVGFHDFLSVLISGNDLITKTSSKDSSLIVMISDILCSINPKLRKKIKFSEGPVSNFDIVIATGTNNSFRYFDYYFKKYPNIIRKNRNSIAIICGDETDEELQDLGKDIFLYFGLGCRNVSKIFIPKGYDFSTMIKSWSEFSGIINHRKYANNYNFNKAVYMVNKEKFHDTGFMLLKEDSRLSSPISVLHYEYYESQTSVKQQIELLKEGIQCIVGRGSIPFGKSQSPHLWDYADGIDTIEFLLKN